MLGQRWKTAEKVREVRTTLYRDQPDGLSGNEDVGQMSAWYVLSSLGMYEVEPAGGRYWFGSPLFDRAEIAVPGGTFTIVAENNSSENKYIRRVWLNGRPYTKPWIGHEEVMAGGELRFEMDDEPHVWYCPEEPGDVDTLDLHGCDNVPTIDIPSSKLSCGNVANSTQVRIKKYEGDLGEIYVHRQPKTTTL